MKITAWQRLYCMSDNLITDAPALLGESTVNAPIHICCGESKFGASECHFDGKAASIYHFNA